MVWELLGGLRRPQCLFCGADHLVKLALHGHGERLSFAPHVVLALAVNLRLLLRLEVRVELCKFGDRLAYALLVSAVTPPSRT